MQIHLLSLMDPTRLPDFVLLVAPDSLTKTVDYTDRTAAVLWGDAAAAAVVSTRIPGRARILGSTLASFFWQFWQIMEAGAPSLLAERRISP